MLLLLLIWVLLDTLFSVVTTQDIVPISQVYANFDQPPKGMTKEGSVESHGNSKKIIVISLAIASAVLCGVLVLLCCLWICRQKILKKSAGEKQQQLDVAKRRPLVPGLAKLNSRRMGGSKKGNVPVMEYQLLAEASNNFDESSKIGEGGVGCVYKACLSENCTAAVKMFNGGVTGREFQNEIGWLSKIQHQNLVSLLGYCINDDTKFLIYEMMHNGSLENQLHGPCSGSALNWSLRMKIALDIARGLEYLHERCDPAVIHRNIKSSNILLDSKFNAKLSGFSAAATTAMQNKNELKISENLGYIAPEYLMEGKLTDKSDVYAFGVVLLELLTGRKPVEKLSASQHQSLVTWAMPQFTDRVKLPSIVDPVIRDQMDPKHLFQVAAVAVLCVQPEPSYRPLITDVLHSLIPLVPVELGTDRGNLELASETPIA